MGYPGLLPEPPDSLSSTELPLLAISTRWHRCHRARFEALHFGRSGAGRFDDPAGEFGVLYVSGDPHGAFIETFGRRLTVRIIAMAELAERRLTAIETTRPLILVDLTGPGLAGIGADARLFTGSHAVAQRWARALWQHPSQPDGLYYLARHDPSRPCAALFNRAADAVRIVAEQSFSAPESAEFGRNLLRTYRFDLLVLDP